MILDLWSASKGAINVSVPALLGSSGNQTFSNAGTFGAAAVALSGFATVSATRDPLVTDDVTQGIVVGHGWYNTVTMRDFECVNNAAGNAQWVFDGAYYAGGGTNPNNEATQAGSSTASIAAEGNMYREVLSAAGGRTPGGTGSGAFFVLGLATIPASALDGATLPSGTVVSNRGINVQANGSLGATGNTKRILMIANPVGAVLGGSAGGGQGGTVIADSAASTVNGSGWCLAANIFKFGGPGSNTQLAIHEATQLGATVSTLLPCQNLALNESGAITIALVASCTTLATDVTYNFMDINFMN